MAEYRGSDGWLHDGSEEGPRRYQNKENVSGPKPETVRLPKTECPNCGLTVSWRRLEGKCFMCNWSEPPPTHQPDPDKGPRAKCPNCDLSASWRRLEGVCMNCNWGAPKPSFDSADDAGACCGVLGFVILVPLIMAGMGYGLGGFGGLLVGFGLGAAIPIGLFVYGLSGASKKSSKD